MHSHDAYHQQAEGTHLGTGVAGKRKRDKQVELGVNPTESEFANDQNTTKAPSSDRTSGTTFETGM